jgi:hypothetical protein
LFPPGKVYSSVKELRDELGLFGQRKGFIVTTVGCSLLCNRCDEPTSQKNRRCKLYAPGHVPMDKRRNNRSSTRCGFPFRISFSLLQKQNKTNHSIKLTHSCNYQESLFPVPFAITGGETENRGMYIGNKRFSLVGRIHFSPPIKSQIG